MARRSPILNLEDVEAEPKLLVFEQLAPIDKKKDADDEKAGDEGHDAFPVRLAMKEVAQVRARVLTGENEDAIGN